MICSGYYFTNTYFFRICPRLSIERVFVVAGFANTALCSGAVVPSIYLVFHLAALWAASIFVYCLFFHGIIITQKTLLVHSFHKGSGQQHLLFNKASK
jgi:hypothetical protein